MKKAGIQNKILKAGGAVFIAHLLFKLISSIQFFIIGGLLPTNEWEAIYGFAFEGVIFSLFLIGEEMIGPALLPVFSEAKEQSEERAWHFANTLLTVQFIVLGIVILILMLFPETITHLLTYWRAGHASKQYSLAIRGVRYLAPTLLCLSLASTTYILLNSYKRFFLAAFGDTMWKFGVLVSVVGGVYMFGATWKSLIFGIVAGSLLKLLTHLVGLRQELKYIRFRLDLNHPMFKKFLILILPLLVGILFAKARDFYNYITVLSSLETEGLIKANAYGRKLFQFVGFLVPFTLSIAMFPFFCDLVNKNNKEELGQVITQSGRILIVLFLPVSMLFLVYSYPLVELLKMGHFSIVDAYRSGISMACYTLVLPAYAIEMLLMQAFFANRKMVSVTVIGISFSSLSIVISYIGIIKCHCSGTTALVIVALGYAISRIGKAITLGIVLKKTLPIFPTRETLFFFLKVVSMSAVSTLLCYFIFIGFDHIVSGNSKLFLLLKLAIGGSVAAGGYLLACYLLHVDELKIMFMWCLEKIKLKKMT